MQRPVEITNNGLVLRGMLHIPDSVQGKTPGVVIYHGFTGDKMEPHFIFVKLSRLLEKQGIANIRFDFGGSGESDGNFEDMTPQTELSDAKAILNYFRSFEFINMDRIGICGLSMGGYIGGITAGDNRDIVKALCMWAPAGNIKDIFQQGMQRVARIREGLYDVGGNVVNIKMFESAASINHMERTAAFDKETCIIHGTGDTSVPYEIGLKYKRAMKNPEFHTIEGADHTFNKYEWERRVIDITVDFFRRTL